jgi:alpha-tubulin suppressor-like RCC1 family protein
MDENRIPSTNVRWVSVAAGSNHSLAVTDKGELYACGNNVHGQLGLTDIQDKMFFSSIHSLEEANITNVYAGGDHSLVLLDKN